MNVLHFPHSVFIVSLLFILMTTVDGAKLEITIGRCVGVENPYIKKCLSEAISPEALHTDVESCSVLSVGGSIRKCMVLQQVPGEEAPCIHHGTPLSGRSQ